jgi:hypothetical protein
VHIHSFSSILSSLVILLSLNRPSCWKQNQSVISRHLVQLSVPTHSPVVLISEPVVLDILLGSLLLQGFYSSVTTLVQGRRGSRTKITIGALALAQLGLQSPDPLPELIRLSGVTASLGRFSLESSVLLLNSDEVEDDVEDS